MKTSSKKPLIISALTALAFAGAGAGATFALFTSQSEATINATAGKIDVSAEVTHLVTYSAEANVNGDRIDENGGKYISKQTSIAGTFTNGGSASIANSVLSLDRLTPGDRVTFDYEIGHQSNVNFLYRVSLVSTGTAELLQGLVTKMTVGQITSTYVGLERYVSSWELVVPTEEIGDLAFDIELPIDAGNEYQNTSASFVLSLEAVQANAYVEDEAVAECHIVTVPEILEPAVETSDGSDLTITSWNSAQDMSVTVTIPSSTSEVSSGDEVTLSVSDAEVTTFNTSGTSMFSFDITLEVNGVQVSSYSEDIEVEVYIGTKYHIAQVTHNGVALSENDYTYDPTEGIVRFHTSSFSPFTVEYYERVAEVETYEELAAAVADPFTKVVQRNDITIPLSDTASGIKVSGGALNVYLSLTAEVAEGVTFDGNGFKLIAPRATSPFDGDKIFIMGGCPVFRIVGNDVIIQNMEFDANGALIQPLLQKGSIIDANHRPLTVIDSVFKGSANFWGAGQVFDNVTADLTLEGCEFSDVNSVVYESSGNVFSGTILVDHCDVNVNSYTFNIGETSGPAELIVKDSSIKGWTSYAGLDHATFTDCSFGTSLNSLQQSGYGSVRFYSDTTFNRCVIDDDITGEIVEGATLELNACKLRAVANEQLSDLTAANYKSLLGEKLDLIFSSGFANDGEKIVVNETVVSHTNVANYDSFEAVDAAVKALFGADCGYVAPALDAPTTFRLRVEYLGENVKQARLDWGYFADGDATKAAAEDYEALVAEQGYEAVGSSFTNGKITVRVNYSTKIKYVSLTFTPVEE